MAPMVSETLRVQDKYIPVAMVHRAIKMCLSRATLSVDGKFFATRLEDRDPAVPS